MVKKILGSLLIIGLLAVTIQTLTNKQQEEKPVLNQKNDKTVVEAASTKPSNRSEGIQVGQIPPNFTLETLDGNKIQLSDLKGKKVFLNFWATWCPPCKQEMPEMQKFYEKYSDEVEVIALNATGYEQNMADIQKFVTEGSYTFPILLDKELKVIEMYKVLTIPTTYFIGTDGKIQLTTKIGPMTYEDMVHAKNKLK
ncbi:redoxin domain-containing protein [Aquibacillus sp. 3ASR75-11]|uniref:Redoxin domain-containing protein n=1 Tax=Terrihalobacillus insolitus TaxID=2950438 RepID=A0A9X3WUM4_9BACI|nr:redoxin domain-containing protein [Terrihalobacillus insolitus]MDC3415021.1 redoxin domain-containing protein [Terrihalobacillus insolitus]MDC3425925.1 redoxin domain-containing protein [Terrihalobacillus insolitus]